MWSVSDSLRPAAAGETMIVPAYVYDAAIHCRVLGPNADPRCAAVVSGWRPGVDPLGVILLAIRFGIGRVCRG